MRPLARISAVLLLCAATCGLAAQNDPTKLMEQAREAYQNRWNPAKAKTAVDFFAQASKADPKSYEALWEGARACYFYGNFSREEASDSEKMAIFQDGIDRAKPPWP